VRSLFLVCFLLLPGIVSAQTASPPLTADNAVALAIKNNPRLSAAVRDVTAARSGLRSARALANPIFFAAPSVPNANGATDALLFQQPLELNGTRSARTGVANAQLKVTQARAIVEVRGLVFDVKSAYYELARARELLALSQSLLATVQEFDRLTRRQVELGARPGIDLAQTGLEVTRAQQRVTFAESRVTTASIALNTLLNRPTNEPIGTLSALLMTVELPDVETALRQALEARAEIIVEDATRDSFRQQARLARAEGRPDLSPTFRSNEIVRSFAPRDYGVSLAVSLPLFDWGSRRNRIRQNEEAAQAQTDRIAAVQNQVRQEVTQAFAQLQATEKILRDYQGGILDQSRRLLEGAQRAFQTGAPGATILTVLEAQRTFRSVQSDYLNLLANYAQSRAELERATGAVPTSLLPQAAGTGVPPK
jgi:outer membrane protein, heavy metal efflux system